jgi:hypothetical protein
MRRTAKALPAREFGIPAGVEPSDRIKELSDASVPFEFDVHATNQRQSMMPVLS